jgi:hypothetical protein
MNSSFKRPEKLSSPLEYAPRWMRDQERQVREHSSALPEDQWQRSAALDRDVGGNRAMMEVRQQLPLDPEQVPEPTSYKSTSLRLIVLQMCAISGFAALVAWAVVSLLAPKQTGKETAQVKSPSVSIVGYSAKQVPAQSLMTVAPAERPAVAGANEPLPGGSASTVATNEPLQRPDLVPATHEQRRPPGIEETPGVNILPPEANTTPGPAPADRQPGGDPAAAPTANQSPLRTQDAPGPAAQSARSQTGNKSKLLDAGEIGLLIKRGKDLITNGDFAAARLLLKRAADSGSGEAALALGATFDPSFIHQLGAIGIQPDVDRAREWYQKAAALGSNTASKQLANLQGAH